MASTFHGGIAFELPPREETVSATLKDASLKLTYRLTECAVGVGDSVAAGDRLGKLNSLTLRASLSGKVTAMATDESGLTLTLESDGEDRRAEALPFGKKLGKTLTEATADELLAELEEAGIVEQSGEALVDHVKRALACEPGKLRLAAALCFDLDPLAATNLSLTEEKADAVAGGLTILLKLLSIAEGAMLCDSRCKASIRAAEDACADSALIAIEYTPNRYPQADRRLLTRWLTGKELSASRAPEDAGLFLTDAETCASLYRLFATGLPERFKRVSLFKGDRVKCCDLPYGLELESLSWLGILPEPRAGESLCRGGMDGRALPDTVDATLNTVALLPECERTASSAATDSTVRTMPSFLAALASESGCIACGRCAEVCPMFLLPYDYLPKSRLQKLLGGSPKDASACIGCGCCSYVCPAGLHLRSAVLAAARKEAHDGK